MNTTQLFRALFITPLMVAGCTTTIVPPCLPHQPTAILITDYGRHSSLLLPDPHGGMIEYAFGDWNWYACGKKNPINAVIALIDSPQSTLGRRWIAASVDAPNVNTLIGDQRTERVIVNGGKVAALRQHLDREYTRHTTVIFNPSEQLYFVRCDEPYNLFRNCNVETANWLRQLGVKVEGFALFSHFRVAPCGRRCE
jgi:hypothetical protein